MIDLHIDEALARWQAERVEGHIAAWNFEVWVAKLIELEGYYALDDITAAVEAIFLCGAAGIAQPNWVARANREIIANAIKGNRLSGKKGAYAGVYARWRKNVVHRHRYDFCDMLLADHGRAQGGPVRSGNLFQIAAHKARCYRTGRPFSIDTAVGDSANEDPVYEERLRKSYNLVRKALKDQAKAHLYRRPIDAAGKSLGITDVWIDEFLDLKPKR